MRKKRPSREELLEAGKFAKDLLVKRKIILSEKDSAIDKILKDEKAPPLPGIPAYLPYPWTIHATRRVIFDLGKAWQIEVDESDPKKNRGPEFFKFAIEGLNKPESDIAGFIEKTVEEKKYDQRFLSRKDALKAIRRFMVDSFAISVIAKSHIDTADFFEWFMEWSDRLLNLWPTSVRFVDAKITKTNVKKDNDVGGPSESTTG
ncbi:MAG: hypothetical protein ACYDBV_12770 [Nitrospiria bacterium]